MDDTKNGNKEIDLDAEKRILVAVEKVDKKVTDLTKTTGAFQLSTAVAIAKIEQIEATCPIREVESTVNSLRTVVNGAKTVAESAKVDARRISAGIASIVGAIIAAVVSAVIIGGHLSGGN